MNILDKLERATHGLVKTLTPFIAWNNSPIKEWTITLRIATIGDLVDIARLTGNTTTLEASYLRKVYLLAKCIESINNQPIVDFEEVEQYNIEHNFSGMQKISIFDYKVMHIKKWTEPIINRLAFVYDELQDEYLAEHLGVVLPPEMRAAVDGVDLANTYPPEREDILDDVTSDDTENS